MLTDDFLAELKRRTLAKWRVQEIKPDLYGFQFQRGTCWNAGLRDDEIAEYERAVQARFPNDLKRFLRAMNGTDLPTLNVYGSSGEPPRTSQGVYSFPRDVEEIRRRTTAIYSAQAELIADLAEQGFVLPIDARLIPIYDHRYVVCTSDINCSTVLSIVLNDIDAIVYANSLREYLEREFLDGNT